MKWEKLKLKDVCVKVTKGTTPSTYGFPFVERGINYIKAESILEGGGILPNTFAFIDEATHEYLKRSILCDKDILISIAGAKLGKCGFLTEQFLPANTNQAVGIVRIDANKAEPKYVYYNFVNNHTYQRINSLNSQAAQPNLNLGQLGEIEFQYPPRSTQRRIAFILSAYDDLIENNLKRIKLLEEKSFLSYKGILKSAKLDEFTIEEVCDTLGGGTPATGNRQFWDEGETIWFSPTDLTKHNSIVLLDSEKKITELGLQKSSAKLVPPKTILMTSRASIGYFGLINKPACTNQGFINIIPFIEYHRAYMLFDLKSRKEEIIGNANGSTFLEISKGKFRQMKIHLPHDESVLIEFEKEFELTFKLIENLLKQNEILREARDVLLPRLMCGKIEL